jgi:basic membrane lipoprotein Med (substrate-binding protein (PBP1-ABC) superfamily)
VTRLPGLLALCCCLAPAMPALAADPTTVRIAGVLFDGIESAWEKSFVDSFHRVAALHPHKLDVRFDYTENVTPDQAEQVIRDYAETGRYDIVFTDSSYADAIDKVHGDFPDLLFVFSGAGNHGIGGNAYWVTIHQHESGYLLGMLAARLSKSGTIGIVASFPGDDTNDEINGFFQGARSVDPKVSRKLSFIQSWYDPQKSASATAALVAAGADYILELSPAFEACQAARIGCFGNYVDFNALAPDTVVTSSLAIWDPDIGYILDQWWAHRTAGARYQAGREPVWFPMAEGGTDIAPYHNWDSRIPEPVKAEIAAARSAILAGTRTIKLDLANAKPD